MQFTALFVEKQMTFSKNTVLTEDTFNCLVLRRSFSGNVVFKVKLCYILDIQGAISPNEQYIEQALIIRSGQHFSGYFITTQCSLYANLCIAVARMYTI